jgi:ubiquinone/menaquinone biosynthesis C-methylase UbiE
MPDSTNRIPDPFDGPFGYVSGLVMGWLNRDMEEKTIARLNLRGDERILEIGFGHGVGLEFFGKKLVSPESQVCGIEPSPALLRRALKYKARHRNVDLRLGVAEHLDWPDGFFDGICAVNTVQFWDPLLLALQEAHRVLKPRGKQAISFHDWSKWKSGFQNPLLEFPLALKEAGFTEVRAWQERAVSGNAFYFTAERS